MDYREEITEKMKLKLITTSCTPAQQRDVINALMIVLGDYEVTERCTALAAPDRTNEHLLQAFIGSLMVEGKSKTTLKQYKRQVELFGEYVGKPYTEVGTFDVRRYLAYKLNAGCSDRSVENLRAYLSSFYAWMTREEIIQKSPVDKIAPVKYNSENEKQLTGAEISVIRDTVKSDRDRAIIETMLATGARVTELVDMDISDLNMQTLTIMIRNGKGGKSRPVYITPTCAMYLNKYLKSRDDGGPEMFHGQRGRLTDEGVRNMLKSLEVASGVHGLHPHRFRHTFATNLSRSGMDVQEIQQLLGHVNLNTTMIYVDTDTDRVRTSYRRHTA